MTAAGLWTLIVSRFRDPSSLFSPVVHPENHIQVEMEQAAGGPVKPGVTA